MKKITYFIIFLTFILYTPSVFAIECTDACALNNFCESCGVLKTFYVGGYLLLVVKIIIPVILIIMGSIDVGKAAFSNEENIKNHIISLIKKIGLGVAIFFIPTIITVVFNIVNGYNESKNSHMACVSCFTDPTSCNLTKNDDICPAPITSTSVTKIGDIHNKTAGGYGSNGVIGGQEYDKATDRQKEIVNIANSTPSAGAGFCERWVANVFDAAGIYARNASAYDSAKLYVISSDASNIPVGACVYGTGTNSNNWGHVGIYIGDGIVMDNQGDIKTSALSDWISWQTDTIDGQTGFLGWGWFNNEDLTK